MDKPVAAAPTGAKEKVEKQARQLAYDVRYKTKQSMAQKSGGRLDPAQVQKAYMSQLAKSPAPPAVKSRAKQMLMGEDYKKDLGKLVSDSAATALYKVFVEHHQKDKDGNTIPHEGEEINEEEKQYKVRVTDKKTSNSYVRMATRSKIAELRSNPNISSVEMTEYGSPTKSEKLKGKQTAKVKQGLDPVGKEDSDVNNDGKVNSSDKYLMKRRKAIGKAMAKEEYSWRNSFSELIEKKHKEEKKLTGEGVDNKKLIKVFPDDVKEMYGSAAGTGASMAKPAPAPEQKPNPQIAQKEKKQAMLKKQVLMKKLQAVRAGAGSDITSSYEPEGEIVEDMGEKEHEDKVRSQIKNLDYGAKSEADYEAAARKAADASARRRRQKENAAKVRRSEMGAARRREKRNELRRQGKYKGPMEGVEMKPVEKTPEGMGDITFDAGGAIPTTIKAIGDPRELETAMKLKKTQLRASGLNMSYEPKGDNISDAYVVNQADKTSNTPAYQGYKAGKKNQITGEPLYKKGNMKENLVTISNINVKPSAYKNEKDVIKEILEKGTRGEVGFRSGGQVKKDPKTGKEKYVQAMKTDKVTVMNKGTKASGGKKARKRPESPEGKAIGALMRHKTKQYSSERKASDARKAGDKKTAAKHDAAANRAYQRRRRVSGTLFDKTGNFHDRADND